jgi:hypothetical protein
MSEQPCAPKKLLVTLNALIRLGWIGRSNSGAGALGLRDFSGLLAAKESRTGSRQTLLRWLRIDQVVCLRLIDLSWYPIC